ncbi:MAG: FAD-dependent oxidoreductase, partial [Emcibacteraceae bacterium]|nr:FAD-dependent oxidoreductase [Emcibacteraceae bacterium]
INFVKKVTKKPVVGVGRFTSPDTMVSQVKRGVLDLIGAARPSIADPFLPNKIKENRVEEIRECIGCNMCTSGDHYSVPIRCTQNPTMGEEWRKEWHPEHIEPAGSDAKVLIIGAGPAGLEAGLALSNRGYDVTIAEKATKVGGRVNNEAMLPGLASWHRVIDYRSYLISQKANINIYLESDLSTNDVLEFGFQHVFIATGATWRNDGVGRSNHYPIDMGHMHVLSPDQIMSGERPTGKVLIYDDDHYYMANALAELLNNENQEIIYVTPADKVAAWTIATLEQHKIQKALLDRDIEIICGHTVTKIDGHKAILNCTYTGKEKIIEADTLVPVTSRIQNDALYHDVMTQKQRFMELNIKSISPIGDCYNPSTIAAAVYHGHLSARQLDNPNNLWTTFKRENDLNKLL